MSTAEINAIYDSLNPFQKMRFDYLVNNLIDVYEKDASFRNGNGYTIACFERDLVRCIEAILAS